MNKLKIKNSNLNLNLIFKPFLLFSFPINSIIIYFSFGFSKSIVLYLVLSWFM